MLYALDIETAPKADLKETAWIKSNKDKLALYPQYSTITKIGLWSPEQHFVFNTVEDFKKWFSLNTEVHFVLHRFSFDLFHLLYNGCDIPLDSVVADTQILFHVIPEKIPEAWLKKYEVKRLKLNKTLPQGVTHRNARELSLKTLAPYFLKTPPFWENPADHANDEYVLKDCEYTYKLFQVGVKKLQQYDCNGFFQFELQAAKMLYRMKQKGIAISFDELSRQKKVNEEKLQELHFTLKDFFSKASTKFFKDDVSEIKDKYSQKLSQAIEKLKDKKKIEHTIQRYQDLCKKAQEKLPKEIEINSDSQLLKALKYYGYSCKDFKGKEGTGKEVLQGLVQQGHKEIQTILDYRHCQKRLTSYFPSYEALSMEGVMHPDWNITGTRTGRLSSSNPNLQQVSSDLKPIFVARPGYKLLFYDASAIEAKLIALYSNDKRLFEIVKQGHSIHDYRTKYVFFKDLIPEIADCPIEDIKEKYPKERFASKTVGFARFYGASWRLIQASLKKAGFKVSDEEAYRMWELDREFFQTATKYHLDITDAFKEGRIINNLVGRPINIEKQSDCYMKGFNKFIQSSASDLNLKACMETERMCFENGWDAYPVALVHDEIVFEAKEDVVSFVEKTLVHEMTKYDLQSEYGPVALTVEGGVSDVWRK